MAAPIDITRILQEALRARASDVHLVPGLPVVIRVNGELIPLPDMPTVDAESLMHAILNLLNETQRARFEKDWSVDSSLSMNGIRYRVSITLQRQGIEAVFRIVPNRIPTADELQLPASVVKLAELKRGMILVTGPAGSGKSTTIASLIDIINHTRRAKIITIEDPIEFVYVNKQSLVSQREVGQHTPHFAAAMRDLLRQDPDVILVGEMRDYETIAAAMQVADTGHLVFATLHANDAVQAVERIINVFPGDQQHQVRTQLAGILRATIGQTLLPRIDGRGRVAAFEIMLNTSAVSAMIRQGRTHEIYSAIEMGVGEGMKTLGRSLGELVKAQIIDPAYAQDPTSAGGRKGTFVQKFT